MGFQLKRKTIFVNLFSNKDTRNQTISNSLIEDPWINQVKLLMYRGLKLSKYSSYAE